MKYSNIPLAQTIAELCKAYNIQHIVISPGSRSAALTISFTNNNYFKCYSIVDERCAGFFALGIAQQLRQPVALVCTSGSALLNYYPAISEAFYSDVPLVVLSADRPKYLVDIGDGQTIKQANVYGDHVHYSTNLKLDLRDDTVKYTKEEPKLIQSIQDKAERFLGIQEDTQAYNEREINTAFHKSIALSGPVHLNCPFEEPLYSTVEELTKPIKKMELGDVSNMFLGPEVDTAKKEWEQSSKKMILIGANYPDNIDSKWLEALANDNSVIVFTETTSNIHNPAFFSSIDKIIAPLDEDGFLQLQPDILLTIGGMIVSKKIKAFLRKHQPKQHWHVGINKANDTFFCLNKHFKMPANSLFKSILDDQSVSSDYKTTWLQVRTHRKSKHEAYLNEIPFCDFKVFDVLLKSIPDHSQLQVSNSSAVRYTQLFDLNPTLSVFCNRGTSGIDGSSSTAIGAASVATQPVVFITGDLSFFYDSNALWNNYIPNNFRILLINNGGGGIFRILPGHKNTENFDAYFETKHQLTAKQLCEMYGFDYTTVTSEEALKNKLQNFYTPSDAPKLLEIHTPSRINDEVLLEYFNYIK